MLMAASLILVGVCCDIGGTAQSMNLTDTGKIEYKLFMNTTIPTSLKLNLQIKVEKQLPSRK
ncbi:hypothetical protein BVRB_8g191800 [Beta vulgaris subsp. vulgaris]|nr:hypothetical protein BVRB_8g191800 [Beta vulgaris subsp. vulgaris]